MDRSSCIEVSLNMVLEGTYLKEVMGFSYGTLFGRMGGLMEVYACKSRDREEEDSNGDRN